MAEDKGGFLERLQYWHHMRQQGALDSWHQLPTREDYRQWLLINTEGSVQAFHAEQPTHRWMEEGQPLPYEQTRAALQDALGETLALLHDHHPHSAEWLEVQAEAAELREGLQALDRQPVDVSTGQTPSLEQEMQSLKARMERVAGLEAVVIAARIVDLLEEAQRQGLVVTGPETPAETPALKQQQKRGY